MKTQSGTIINGSTDKGAYRESNQDAFNFVQSREDAPYGLMLLVADGVGGQKDGDYAAALAAQITLETFYRQRREGVTVETALRLAVDASNQAVHAHSQSIGASVSCTLVVAVLANGLLFTAHVGDARAYRLKDDALQQLTADHSWVAEQVRKGILTAEQAEGHHYKNVILKAVGNKSSVSTEIKNHGALLAGETLVLCSDGLYNTLSEGEMLTVIKSNAAEHWAERLVGAAKGAAKDNVTAVTVLIPEGDQPATTVETDTIKLDPIDTDVAAVSPKLPQTESDLEPVVENKPTPAPPAPAEQDLEPETPSRRRILPLILLSILLMLILVFGGIFLFQPALLDQFNNDVPVRGSLIPQDIPLESTTIEATPFVTSTPIPATLSSIEGASESE